MEISAVLAVQLAILTEALGADGIDLEEHVKALLGDLAKAVPSAVGITVTIGADEQFTTITTIDRTRAIAASLRVPLLPLKGIGAGSSVAFLAATPGAFVDLGADLAHALGVGPSGVILDGDLTLPDDSEAGGLEHASVFNRAVGVLVERGFTIETARGQLDRMATDLGGDVLAAAYTVLGEIPRP